MRCAKILFIEVINMNVGLRLRKARERRELSQLEVSKRTNINNKTLSRYENGNSEPDYTTLKLLAELYDVSVSFFFEEDNQADVIYDLKELLKDKKLSWGTEELNEEEKQRAIEIINILLKTKDTSN
jgi:transcriptional regulator with XRE-family HTH domain